MKYLIVLLTSLFIILGTEALAQDAPEKIKCLLFKKKNNDIVTRKKEKKILRAIIVKDVTYLYSKQGSSWKLICGPEEIQVGKKSFTLSLYWAWLTGDGTITVLFYDICCEKVVKNIRLP